LRGRCVGRVEEHSQTLAHIGVAAVEPHITAVSGRATVHLTENAPEQPTMYTLAAVLLGVAFAIGGTTLGMPEAQPTLDGIFSSGF